MRDKARHGTEKVQRTLRNRSLRIGIGLAVLFAFGLMASGAFGESLSVLTTSTDTTASNSASTTDTTSAPSSDTTSSSDTSTDTSSSATVAVLDTGVDASQPDLQGAVVPGANIVAGSGDGTSDPNGHGTEMAGIVAAATDNGEGIAGVGYSGVKVMPVTVLGADGT